MAVAEPTECCSEVNNLQEEDYNMEEYQVITRTENVTEQDDKNLAGATKEYRNELSIFIPENPFPEILLDGYPPLKFTWVIPKKICAMAFPRNVENLQWLINQGIDHLVTLTAGKKPPLEGLDRLRWTEIPIEEFTAPSLEHIKKFIEICKKSEKSGEVPFRSRGIVQERPPGKSEVLGIHCRQGRGRSGVLLACYLIHFHRFEPDQAMNTIRMIRPGSCDAEEHEEAVGMYFQDLTQDNPLRFGVSPDVMEEFIDSAKDATKKSGCNNVGF